VCKILIVEDDPYLREELVNTFVKTGYDVGSISSFARPEQTILAAKPDLVILDINLPTSSGFDVCKKLKKEASFPILVLTSRDQLGDELRALGVGADDFLTKPCHPDRLIARSERLLHTYVKVKNVIQLSDLILDTDTYKVVRKNKHVVLSQTEGRMLKFLLQAHPTVVTKEEMIKEVWGEIEYVDENILQVNMTRLRKSLGVIGLGMIIKTIRGQGYVLEV